MANIGNAAVAYTWLIAKGLTPPQAAGVVGNLMAESSVQPNGPNGDSGIAHGIAQWHPDRWGPLASWAQQNGLDPNTLTGQLAMLWQELNTTESGSLAALRTTSDPAGAAQSFAGLYERCQYCASGGGSVPQRIANANAVFNGTATSGSSPGAAAGAFPSTTDTTTLAKVTTNPNNPCQISTPSFGGVAGIGKVTGTCLWRPSYARAFIGAVLLGAGAITVVLGIGLIAKSEMVKSTVNVINNTTVPVPAVGPAVKSYTGWVSKRRDAYNARTTL